MGELSPKLLRRTILQVPACLSHTQVTLVTYGVYVFFYVFALSMLICLHEYEYVNVH